MKVLDLFSGIGGFSLGLERAGMKTVAFCEIEPYCRAVLKRHWPDVPIYDDVRSLTAGRLVRDGIAVDIICGGFPCQDISVAGKGAGLAGERSGLWFEYARIIGEIRPRYVIVENVAALLGRGLDRVLGDVAALGYDAEWHCIPASAVGAPHRRDRLWIVGFPNLHGRQKRQSTAAALGYGRPAFATGGDAGALADTSQRGRRVRDASFSAAAGEGPIRRCGCERNMADTDEQPLFGPAISWPERHPWRSEPDVDRMAHGVPSRVDRLRSLGNAVVPQIPEMIGRAILATQ